LLSSKVERSGCELQVRPFIVCSVMRVGMAAEAAAGAVRCVGGLSTRRAQRSISDSWLLQRRTQVSGGVLLVTAVTKV
jgi:hypothetical protein